MRHRAPLLFAWPLLVSRPAAAELALDWHAPRGCPQADEVRAGIAELVGKDLDDPAIGAEATVQVERVSPSDLKATIRIRVGATSRERVLHDGRCSVLTRAASIVVALAVAPRSKVTEQDATLARAAEDREARDETGAAEAPAPRPAEAPPSSLASASASASTAAPAPPADVDEKADREEAVEEPRPVTARVVGPAVSSDRGATAPSRNRRRRDDVEWSPYLGAGAALLSGVLPGVAPAVVITGGLELERRWRFSLHGTYAPPRSATLAALGGVGGTVGLFAAAVDAGVGLHFSALEVPLYAGFEAGAFDATGQAVTTSGRLRPLWLAAYAGTGAVYSWNGWLATGLKFEGLASLRQPRFAVQSSAGEEFVFHRPSAVAARGVLELQVTLK